MNYLPYVGGIGLILYGVYLYATGYPEPGTRSILEGLGLLGIGAKVGANQSQSPTYPQPPSSSSSRPFGG